MEEEPTGKGQDKNPTPMYTLIDGGALWSSFQFIASHLVGATRTPAPAPPAPIEHLKLEPAALGLAVAANEEVLSGAQKEINEDKGKNQEAALTAAVKLARKQSRSPEMFEELMLGKSKKPKLELNEANVTATGSKNNRRRKQTLESRKMANYVEYEGMDEDHQYYKPTLAEISAKKAAREDSPGPSSPSSSSRDADATELPSTVLEEYFPKGYDPFRRRSDRIEARAIGQRTPASAPDAHSGDKKAVKDRRGVAKTSKARKTSMSSANRFNSSKKKPSLQVLAELLSTSKADSLSRRGMKFKKRQNRTPRPASSKWQSEEEDVEEDEGVMCDEMNGQTTSASDEFGDVKVSRQASHDSDPANDTSMEKSGSDGDAEADASRGPSANPGNEDNLAASDLSFEQLIVCLGLFKNANNRLEAQIEAAETKLAEAVRSEDDNETSAADAVNVNPPAAGGSCD